ncbi:Nuclear pore complex nucleoporin component [Kappamyces sp. JEL0680]|nr:Nuclear pore complex nucleoporin component [Kappamyces sp. JEL0680]
MGRFGVVDSPSQHHRKDPETPTTSSKRVPLIYTSPSTKTPAKGRDSPLASKASPVQSHPSAPVAAQNELNLKLQRELEGKSVQFQTMMAQRRSIALQISQNLNDNERELSHGVEEALSLLAKMDLAEKERIKSAEQAALEDKRREEERLLKQKQQEEALARAKQEQDLAKRRQEEEAEKSLKAKEAAALMANSAQPASNVTAVQSSSAGSQLPATAQPVQPPPQIVSEIAWKTASEYLARADRVKTSTKPGLLANADAHNQLLRQKMKINRTVGQLTRSFKQLVPLIKALAGVFTEAQTLSPEFYEVIMYLAAKKIVKQAETEVSVKKDSAFPLAVLAVHLFSKHPPFLGILLGRMMKKCPYIVPMYPRKQADETLVDYQKRLGYNVKCTPIENEIQYGERMCGILSLYAAIIQTDSSKQLLLIPVPNAYGIEHAWSWLARMLNMKPRKITPLLLHSFLMVTGHALLKAYPDQGRKLISTIIDGLVPLIPTAAVASTTKLKLFLEETVVAKNSFPLPYGRALEP